MPETPPLFLFGLGAQKAGTSWVHDFLAQHPQANFGPVKEYHCFDALHLDDARAEIDDRDPSPFFRPKAFVRHVLRTGRIPRDGALRRKLRPDLETYVAFFADLVAARRGEKRGPNPGPTLTGDLTPEYGALPEMVMAEVATALRASGFSPRALLLLRDPVERCLSASRMYQNRAQVPFNKAKYAARGLVTEAAAHPFTPHAEMRTRYDVTLARAEAAFGEDAVFVGFYEELFSRSEIARLTSWLGMDYPDPDFGKRINITHATGEKVDRDLRRRIARHYRPVYEDMFRRFGEARVRHLWPSSALLKE